MRTASSQRCTRQFRAPVRRPVHRTVGEGQGEGNRVAVRHIDSDHSRNCRTSRVLPQSRRFSKTMRILVVEDEPRLLRNLAKALREEGYAVDTAEAGDDGLYKAESYSYDAIVLDVMLPRLDGWEVLERLRKQKPTPVLMLTARDAHKDRVRGLDTGADDYLVKPFDLTELLARLRALIRRSAGQARPNIELGDVVIDLRARTINRAGQPVT